MTKPSKFVASEIELLNFSDTPDDSGMLITASTVVDFKIAQRVYYGPPDFECAAGYVRIRRTAKGIVGDLSLYSTMKDSAKALRLMQRLYPAVGFVVRGASGMSISHLEITEVFLTPNKNDDSNIAPVGDRLRRWQKPKELH